jgi:ribosome-binding protein aMBF1 (putative translation factor)
MGAVLGVRGLGNIKLNYRRATMMVQADLFAEVESDLLERIRLRRDYVEAKMKDYVVSEEGCWEYQGVIHGHGYGIISLRVSSRPTAALAARAHRVSYAFYNGVDPAEMHVCHKCDNRKCLNPDHLFLGTHQDNMRDKGVKGRVKGEANPNSKLTLGVVKDVVKAILEGKSNPTIAKSCKVKHNQISRIRHGKAWKDFTASLGYEPAKYIKFKRKKAAEPLE